MFYILKNKIAVETTSIQEWTEWFVIADRKVGRTEIDEAVVSTVFLGLDHKILPDGDPLLFETMVFLSEGESGRIRRYFTWAEAEVGHAQIVEIIQREQSEADMLTIDTLASLMVDVRGTK